MHIVIVGSGGHARVIIDILNQNKNMEVVGLVDTFRPAGEIVDGYAVLGSFGQLDRLIREYRIDGIIIGVGDNRIRADYYTKLQGSGLVLVNAIHPSANIAPNVKIGRGVVVAREAVICTGARIGNNAIINTGCIIDHDCVVGDHCHISSGVNIAGAVTVQYGTFVGIGSTIIQGITIGSNTILGAGSVVIRDIPGNVVAVGVPAKQKKEIDLHKEFGEAQAAETEEAGKDTLLYHPE